MRVKKYLLGFYITAFLVLAFAGMVWNSGIIYNITDKKQWTQKKRNLKVMRLHKLLSIQVG